MTDLRTFTCLCISIGLTCAFEPAVALAADRARAEASFNEGLQSFQAERYQEARQHFQAAAVFEPDFAAAHYLLGLTLLQLAPGAATPAQREGLLQQAADEFKLSRAQDPELIIASLSDGLVQSMMGRYSDADSQFNAYIKQRPDDPLPYLFMAVIYYRQGKTDRSQLEKASENLDKAEQAFNRSPKPDRKLFANIEFYRALIDLQRNRVVDAKKRLAEIPKIAPDTIIQQHAEELLNQIREGKLAARPWDLRLQAGFEWDSNVVLRGHQTPKLGSGDESWRFGLSSDFTYRFVHTDELIIGAGLNTYDSWHTDIEDFNLQTYGASVFAGVTPPSANWLTLGIRSDWDHTLLGNDTYLLRSRLTPQIDIREGDRAATSLYYQLDARDYRFPIRNRRLDRDGLTHAFGVVQDFAVCDMFDRSLVVSASYRYEDVGTEGREYDADDHIFGLGIDVPLPKDFAFEVKNEWELQYYRNGSLYDIDRSKRRDLIYTFGIGLTKQFNENLSARLSMVYTDDDSNVRGRVGAEPFSYDRVIYGLTFMYRF